MGIDSKSLALITPSGASHVESRELCMQANLAEYDAAARFYTRALLMNPQASGVWGYLRNVILCSGRTELLQAVEDEDLTTLNQALPLE